MFYSELTVITPIITYAEGNEIKQVSLFSNNYTASILALSTEEEEPVVDLLTEEEPADLLTEEPVDFLRLAKNMENLNAEGSRN